MMIPERRAIRPDEVEVLRAAIERAGVAALDTGVSAHLARLAVVARCDCGCATVSFVESLKGERPYPVADGIGSTPLGGRVGVIVWGRCDLIAELEIYDLGAGAGDQVLPCPGSIVPFRSGEAGAAVDTPGE